MKKLLRLSLTVIGIALIQSALAATTPVKSPVPDEAHIQKLLQKRAARLDVHLAAMKAGLHLTAEQEKNWPPFETAIRAVAKMKADRWETMQKRMRADEHLSPIDRMTFMAEHLEKNATEIRTIIDAVRPLYESLDETQKSEFAPLMRAFKSHHQRHR